MSSNNPTINGTIRTNTILDEFFYRNYESLQSSKKKLSLSGIRKLAEGKKLSGNNLYGSLSRKKSFGKLGLIAEIKKSSPSMGIINSGTDVRNQAKLYAENGVDSISVLTQSHLFGGSLADLGIIAEEVSLPILRKDFIFDPYQIYESKLNGASALLLIVMALEKSLIRELIEVSHSIGLDVLTEVHDESELKTALDCHANIIGVNSRDLRTMTVDPKTADRLLPLIPRNNIRIAESGISKIADVRIVKNAGADVILVGTAIMSSKKPGLKIKELLQ